MLNMPFLKTPALIRQILKIRKLPGRVLSGYVLPEYGVETLAGVKRGQGDGQAGVLPYVDRKR
jgi:hypothetical protein